MRILVADQNALLLAAIVRTFGRHCEVVVATRRDACVAHLEERKVDVVVACEKLRDYTGLELLSEVAGLSPETVRIFAARPETLQRLGARLDYFGLLGTLSYPIDARKLLVALKTARGKRATPPKPLKPKVQHVVLDESEWDTGERLGLLERELETAGDGSAQGEGAPATAEPSSGGGEAVVSRREDAGVIGGRAAEWDVQVVESAGWGTKAARVPVTAPRRTVPATTEDTSFEASFDEMPGAIAVAAVRVEPKAAAQSKSSGAAPRTATKRLTATGAAAEGETAEAAAVAGDDAETFEDACNDPDIDAPLPVETFGAANEPSFDKTKQSRGSVKDGGTAAAAGGSNAAGSGSSNTSASSSSVKATASAGGAKADASGGAKGVLAASSGVNVASSIGGAKTDASGGGMKAAGSGGAKGAASSGGKGAASAGEAKKSVPQGPKVRKPTVPTAAQREAFQRAVARRNAARLGGGLAEGGFGFGVGAHYPGDDTVDARGSAAAGTVAGNSAAGGPEPFISTQSLSDLARIVGKKQPLKVFNRTMGQPKRRAMVYGSGVVAAVLAAVVFQLMRATPSEQERHRNAQNATAHLFSPPASLDAGSNSPPPQVFTPTPPHADFPASSERMGPQPQTFDPNTAPEDPPPPPAYQGPGPMEPPSMAHNGPPLEMQQGPHRGD